MSAAANPTSTDTIAARATAPGAAAIAVVRVSGPDALDLAERIAGPSIEPRQALLRAFRDPGGALIDRGLVIYFPGPASFTGEDVVEFQCHGAPAVVDWLIETLHAGGARAAEPGEFSLRAFLNEKLDLTQAEAIADLIGSHSRSAAQAALRSMTGEFATAVEGVQSGLMELRVLCEAWLDFPEEEIDPGTLTGLERRATALDRALGDLERAAGAGAVLTDGLTIAIAGAPNAGKSSLMNRLVATDAAIVSEQPGTTRDALERAAVIAGLPVQLIDTAGLRESKDTIERAGIERARKAAARADLVLWVADIRDAGAAADAAGAELSADASYLLVLNKVDLVDSDRKDPMASASTATVDTGGIAEIADLAHALPEEGASSQPAAQAPHPVGSVRISALRGDGLENLGAAIARFAGIDGGTSGTFSARRRHLAALTAARTHVAAAAILLAESLDLAADELRQAQTALGEVTGEVTSDELLGEIFSTFCIGK